MKLDVRTMDGKVRPTISGPLAVYVKQLVNTGLYGATPTEVVRNLVREGLQKAAAAKLLDIQRFNTK